MLTSFGKALRKLRIDHNELLKDMAGHLNVTVAYLSAVENGKREVLDSWIDILADAYKLSSEDKRELQGYAYEDKDTLKINLQGIEQKEKELALAFARSFKTLSDEEVRTLTKIFDR